MLNRTIPDLFTFYFILELKVYSQEEIQRDEDFLFVFKKTKRKKHYEFSPKFQIKHSNKVEKKNKRRIISLVILFKNLYISFLLLQSLYSISNLSNISFQSFDVLMKENRNKGMPHIRLLISFRKQKQTPESLQHLEPEQKSP